MSNKKILAVAICGLLHLQQSAIAADSFSEAFTQGAAHISFRYRFENVDQDNFARTANASTLRTRFNFKTDDYQGFSFFIEADNVTEVFADNYNAGAGNSPGNTEFPVVADPAGTEINQAWINYQFSPKNSLKVGRQRILLDNQRFVGGVGWRQNEQTYDAVSGTFDLSGSQLFVAYIDNVNRIFGDDVPAGDHENNTYLLNWSKSMQDVGKLSTYYYDIDNQDAAAFSTATYGVKFSGNIDKFNYAAELAKQTDAHNNSVDFSANYWRLDGAYKFEKMAISAGYEVLAGDANVAGSAFRTPLATLHAFNGWADVFLTTPDDGIEDLFVGINGNLSGFKWQALYHDFSAQDSSRDLGDELDLSLGKKVNDNLSVLLKTAFYNADTHATDTTKLWLMLSMEF